uniref:Uncharacterized protein n=2 Tax=Candidatus Kentrum sp. TUN TaxID=2126343 RepID=A0A450ZZS4_9GAMM|nr:MAG: hypothetical protein BECKTUN1418D_GA0071000_10991 [Candidatus Kentron sp. TUN]
MWFASFALFLPSGDVANCDSTLPRRYVYQPRVASLFSQASFTQPRWGWIFVRSLPRVAAAQQPWADIRSPLGQKSALPNPPGTLKPEEPKICLKRRNGIRILIQGENRFHSGLRQSEGKSAASAKEVENANISFRH